MISKVHLKFVEAERTDDDDGAVLSADRNVSSSFISKTCHIRAFGTNDTRENRSIGKGKESDMCHALCVLDSLLNKFLGPFQTCLIASFQSPDRFPIFSILVVGNDFPLNISSGRLIVSFVDSSCRCFG